MRNRMRSVLAVGLCLGVALPIACTRRNDSGDPPVSTSLALSRSGPDAPWVIDGLRDASVFHVGDWFYVYDLHPFPGSEVRPVVGVARVADHTDTQLSVTIVYHDPLVPLSPAGLNPVEPVGAEADIRIPGLFARVSAVDPSGSPQLNIGALDGVFPGSHFELIDVDKHGVTTSLGTCVVGAEDILKTESLCRPAGTGGKITAGAFARLTEQDASGAGARKLLSARGCQIAVPEGGALASLGNDAVCGLLDHAWNEFVSRFGPFGEGGELGVYLDQTYVDPNYVPEDLEGDWSPPPERARLALRVTEWYEDPAQRVLVIFGRMGAGKTTFSMRYAYDLAIGTVERGKGPVPIRVPLLDTLLPGERLADVTGPVLIARALTKISGQTVDPALIRKDVEAGTLLPFFDGFDEVSLTGKVAEALEYYRHLVDTTVGTTGKMIVLSRSSEILGERLTGLTLALDQEVQNRPDQTQLQLIPFTDQVVTTYLERLVPDPALRAQTLAELSSAFELETLARTPMLVYLVAHYVANEGASDVMPSDIYSLYRQYTLEWTETVLKRHDLGEKDVEAFLKRCVAFGLLLDQERATRVDEEVLTSFISNNTWLEAPRTPDAAWQVALREARGGAFLQPTSDGKYRFVDPSFANYFAAEGLIQSLVFVWQEEPPSWAPKPILERLARLNPSPETLRFLREGMGPDPLADRAIQFLLGYSEDAKPLNALYQLRLLRQRLEDPEQEAGDDAIARRSRFSFGELYAEEGLRLREASAAGVTSLLAHPAGARYEAVPDRPWVVRDKEDQSLWAWLPALEFMTGAVADAGSSLSHNRPTRPVLIALRPVTNRQFWDFFVTSGYNPHGSLRTEATVPFLALFPRVRVGSGERGLRFPEELADHPVVAVSWKDITAYAEWRTATLKVDERPPNELEWELAARGTLGRRYPWGDGFDPDLARSSRSEAGGTEPVDTHPNAVSPFGLSDMAGNAAQWVIAENRTNMTLQGVLRGGSWSMPPAQLATYARITTYDRPEYRLLDAGFRMVRELPRDLTDPPVEPR